MRLTEATKITETKLTANTKAAIKEHFPNAVTLGELKECIADDPNAVCYFSTRTFGIIMNILDFDDYDGAPSTADTETADAAPAEIMSDNAKYAYTVHAQIVLGAKMVEDGLYQMAKGFKIMRDEKLYKELGYDTFEKYCEAETGMNRRNVYKYITIVEKIPEDFVSSKAQIGKEKLLLLAALDDEQRDKITENTDLENTTVKELKRQIDELTGKNKKLFDENQQLMTECDDIRNERDYFENELDDLREKHTELELENKELRNKPVETVTVPADPTESEEYKTILDERNKMHRQIIETTRENDRLKERCDELFRQTQEAPAPVYIDSCDIDETESFIDELIGNVDTAMLTFFRFFKEDYPEEVRDIFRRKAEYIKGRIDTLTMMYLNDNDYPEE